MQQTGSPTCDKPENNHIIIFEKNNGLVKITLNRPERVNALSMSLLLELKNTLDVIAEDTSIKVVVIKGAGGNFCSGHDLKEMNERRIEADKGRAYFEKLFKLCSDVMKKIMSLPQPIIAEVQGAATAAGCQLIASCDLAIASKTAYFATPRVNIGLFCATPMVALSRRIPTKHAMEMLILGEPISATRAYEIGLINKIVDEKEIDARVLDIAKKIINKPSSAIRIGKPAFYEQMEMTTVQAYEYTSYVMAENAMYDCAEDGISHFLEQNNEKNTV